MQDIGGPRACNKYKQARNEYTWKFENKVMNSSTGQPKLFYSHVKSKTKIRLNDNIQQKEIYGIKQKFSISLYYGKQIWGKLKSLN